MVKAGTRCTIILSTSAWLPMLKAERFASLRTLQSLSRWKKSSLQSQCNGTHLGRRPSRLGEMSPRYSLRVLKNQEEVMPTWRADYFDKARDQAPTRSVTIEAERKSDALDKARAEMRSACSRAEFLRASGQ